MEKINIIFINSTKKSIKLERTDIGYNYYKGNVNHFYTFRNLNKQLNINTPILITDKYSSVIAIPFFENELFDIKSFLTLTLSKLLFEIRDIQLTNNVFSIFYSEDIFKTKDNYFYFINNLKSKGINVENNN